MKTGIYQIRNLLNGKIYVGSSLKMEARKYNHWYMLKRNKHPNRILQNSWNKYGEFNFAFEMIEECSKDELIQREQYYINTLKPVFNIRPIAESNLGFRFERTPEQKERFREAHRNAVTPEIREKLRMSKPRLGKRNSIEMNRKISEKHKIPILQCDLDGNTIKEWSSAKDAAIALKLKRSTIASCCNKINKTAYGFTWKFKSETLFENRVQKKRQPQSEQWKLKKAKATMKPVIQMDPSGNFIREWSSIKEAGNTLSIHKGSISSVLKGKYENAGGFKWQYKN